MSTDDGIDHRGELDRVALDAHDRQKDWPGVLWSTLVDALRPHLQSPCLEVGVGTGLVALRMAATGTSVIGMDFNRSMLGRLHERAPDFPLLQADALRMPIPPLALRSIVISNVLHLISDWRRVLGEVSDALPVGGSLLVNLGSGGSAPVEATEIRRWFLSRMPDQWTGYGPSTEVELDEAVAALGFERHEPVTATGMTHRSLRDVIARLEQNPFAWPSGVSRELLSQTADAARSHAARRFGSIDEQLEHHVSVRFSIYHRS